MVRSWEDDPAPGDGEQESVRYRAPAGQQIGTAMPRIIFLAAGVLLVIAILMIVTG